MRWIARSERDWMRDCLNRAGTVRSISLLFVITLVWWGFHLVSIPPALLRPPVQSIALFDRNGVPWREARVESRFSRELMIDDVPPHVLTAFLAAEDKRFY